MTRHARFANMPGPLQDAVAENAADSIADNTGEEHARCE